jgi:hypothetical protein
MFQYIDRWEKENIGEKNKSVYEADTSEDEEEDTAPPVERKKKRKGEARSLGKRRRRSAEAPDELSSDEAYAADTDIGESEGGGEGVPPALEILVFQLTGKCVFCLFVVCSHLN